MQELQGVPGFDHDYTRSASVNHLLVNVVCPTERRSIAIHHHSATHVYVNAFGAILC